MSISKNEVLESVIEKLEVSAVQFLKSNDKEYQKLEKEMDKILKENHKLLFFFDHKNEVTLTEHEHETLLHYLDVKTSMDELVKIMLYFCGHADMVNYEKIVNELQMNIAS